jgi:hypothetical protein
MTTESPKPSNEATSGGTVASSDLLGAALQLKKRIPARTVTLKALWCSKDFMLMSDHYRQIRSRLRKPMDTCHICRHKLENGEMMALACFQPGGNKVLCQGCAGELMGQAPNSS